MCPEWTLLLFIPLILASTPFAAWAFDISYRVVSPSLGGGVLFNQHSDQSGICRALGYERAAEGSAIIERKGGYGELTVDKTGEVFKATNEGQTVSEIICLNQVSKLPKWNITTIPYPRHPQSGVGLMGSTTGMCKIYGHDHGVPGLAVGGEVFTRAELGEDGPGPENPSNPLDNGTGHVTTLSVDDSGEVIQASATGKSYVEAVQCFDKN